ncbi:MAG: hypothetical protein WKG32_10930 [Gemmatimonadaceae bacterium]
MRRPYTFKPGDSRELAAEVLMLQLRGAAYASRERPDALTLPAPGPTWGAGR